ncbi:MAG: polymorphic toxin type 24 domain-containing protein [Humibacillus sp.]|nr:polymorphic toxin type 24 domain-containing protein [Humibacillus sp.]MDN5775659.1 polymorphic toxin type 24 domain-containing protein [Humibacillus sp.]
MIPRDTATVDLAVPDGDPASIRAAARRLRQVADTGLATAGVRGEATDELTGVWTGSSATGAGRELSSLSLRARTVLPLVDDGGQALAAYATALETAITAARALSGQARSATDEQQRTLARIDLTHAADPVLHAAAATRAEQAHATKVNGIHRRYGAAMDVLTAAATRCARTLAGLTPSTSAASPIPAAPTLDPSLVDDLPLVRGQLDGAAAAGVGHAAPPDESSWHDPLVNAAGSAGAWTDNHTAVPLVNGAANAIQAGAEHPEDLGQMAFGTGLMFLGAGGEVGGFALDATGVGAVAGVPINIAAAGAVVGGIATAGSGAGRFIQHARANDNRLLQEASGPTQPPARPPTSNWSSSGPHTSPIEGARTIRGLMPKTAGPNETLVRYGDDGKVNCYKVFDAKGLPIKRVDVRGKTHYDVPTPHVEEYTRNIDPKTGQQFVNKPREKPRDARPDEVYGL